MNSLHQFSERRVFPVALPNLFPCLKQETEINDPEVEPALQALHENLVGTRDVVVAEAVRHRSHEPAIGDTVWVE